MGFESAEVVNFLRTEYLRGGSYARGDGRGRSLLEVSSRSLAKG